MNRIGLWATKILKLLNINFTVKLSKWEALTGAEIVYNQFKAGVVNTGD
jgi:hypothetical protein